MDNTPGQRELKRTKSKRNELNKLKAAVKSWLLQLIHELTSMDDGSVDSLLSKLPSSYCIYGTMLLLPCKFFGDPEWVTLMDVVNERQKEELYLKLNSATNTTHIAINAPIPNSGLLHEQPEDNAMRKPRNIIAISGSFGPSSASYVNPTAAEMDEAFWVCTKQNGINQIWSPMYTMFSRGNIAEKARLLRLSSVSEAQNQGLEDGAGWSAIDLFAGIGYFAFSYATAGAKTVVCWEINPWSIEGFKRGAKANNWETYHVMPQKDIEMNFAKGELNGKQFIMFHESNSHAPKRIEAVREVISPIRHVNCGLLPSSVSSWEIALLCLDYTLGGWLHIHENLDARAVETQSALIVAKIAKISQQIVISRKDQKGNGVVLEHVHKVKSYAPNVVHCVLDINIIPGVI